LVRILYVPFFSNLSLGGCSIFNNVKVLLRGLVEANEDMFVYYPLPEAPFDSSVGERYLEHPRIKTIPVKAYRTQEDDLVYVPERLVELFNINDGTYPVDLIICDKHRITVWLDLLINNQVRGVTGNIPIVNWTQYPTLAEGRMSGINPAFEYAQVMGWYAAHNFWTSRHEYQMGLRAARKYGSGSVVQKIMKQSHFAGTMALDCDRILRHSKPKPTEGPVLCNFGNRYGTHYKFDEIFSEFELLFQAGRDVRLVVTTPSAFGKASSMSKKGLNHRRMEWEEHPRCLQEQFYELASQCHVGLYMIKEAGAMLAPREQVFMKIALVIPDAPIFQEILPGYPWVYRNSKEMRTLLRHLVDHYWSEEVQSELQKQSDKMRELWDVQTKIQHVREELWKIESDNRDHAASIRKLTEIALDAEGWPEAFSLDEFAGYVRRNTETKRPISATFSGFSRTHFIWALKDLGYEDTCLEERPTYVRVGGSP
jgi:hypothetical protein